MQLYSIEKDLKDFKTFLKAFKLDEYDKETINNWIEQEKDAFIYVFESDKDKTDYLKEYVINNWQLQYFNIDFLLDNLKQEYINIKQETMRSIIKAIQEQDDFESTNALLLLVDIDELIESAISQDGLGHFINYYDGKEVETLDQSGNWYTITLG
jgi:hypothetical protein